MEKYYAFAKQPYPQLRLLVQYQLDWIKIKRGISIYTQTRSSYINSYDIFRTKYRFIDQKFFSTRHLKDSEGNIHTVGNISITNAKSYLKYLRSIKQTTNRSEKTFLSRMIDMVETFLERKKNYPKEKCFLIFY